MKAYILYSVDDTTTTMTLEGHKVTGQILPDGRGMCQVFDEENRLAKRVLFAKVYLIDME